MMKATKKWLIAASALIVFGLLLFALTMCFAGWNFKKLETEKYETATHEITEAFENIQIRSDIADITFLPAEDGNCRVVCNEREGEGYAVSVTDGTLNISAPRERKWHIGVAFDSDRITVYLPGTEYASLAIENETGDITIPGGFRFADMNLLVSTGDISSEAEAGDVRIASSTGRICVENAAVGSLNLTTSTGKVTVKNLTCADDLKVGVSVGKIDLTDVTCKNMVSRGSTGDVSLCNVVVSETLSVVRSTGDITFRDCDAFEVYARASTGNIKGNFLTDKTFLAKSDTGSIDVPKTATGGKCELITDTGHIRITVR